MYQKILQNPLVFGDDIGSQARSILTGLLTRDPTQRLGVNGAEEIKKQWADLPRIFGLTSDES